MAGRAETPLLSLRAPRDAAISLMQHMGHGFPQALRRVEASALFCACYTGLPPATLLRYEYGFTDTPDIFGTLAAQLGGQLCATAREELFSQSRRAVIEAQIARLPASPTV